MWWILGGIVAAFAGYLWWINREVDGAFDFQDLFIDHITNRASLAKIMLIWLLALSTWVIIVKVTGTYKVDGIETLLLGLVTAFVGQVTVLSAVDKWKGRERMNRYEDDEPDDETYRDYYKRFRGRDRAKDNIARWERKDED